MIRRRAIVLLAAILIACAASCSTQPMPPFWFPHPALHNNAQAGPLAR